MFNKFKNTLKGGIGTVAEKGQNIASNVVNDEDFSTTAIKDKLKETTKRTYKESKMLYKEGAGDIRDKLGDENVDKVQATTKDVAHNIKHYGAFGEDLLGYSDPQKELRKAVKAKEKAAKNAWSGGSFQLNGAKIVALPKQCARGFLLCSCHLTRLRNAYRK